MVEAWALDIFSKPKHKPLKVPFLNGTFFYQLPCNFVETLRVLEYSFIEIYLTGVSIRHNVPSATIVNKGKVLN